MTVRTVKISEAIEILASMLNRNIYFTDIIIKNESLVHFRASKLPSSDEYTGDQILNNINFDDNEEE